MTEDFMETLTLDGLALVMEWNQRVVNRLEEMMKAKQAEADQ